MSPSPIPSAALNCGARTPRVRKRKVDVPRQAFTALFLSVFSDLAARPQTPQLSFLIHMATPAQILANRQNAEKSSGPVTAEGRARVSQNATKLGLFSVANFVRPEEQQTFREFESGYLTELSPDSSLEQTLAREIIHAAWRLRRCANLEIAPPDDMTSEELDRLQTSIDRARAAAQRTFHRSLKELRRLQTERVYATFTAVNQTKQSFELASANPAKQNRHESRPGGGLSSPRMKMCEIRGSRAAKPVLGMARSTTRKQNWPGWHGASPSGSVKAVEEHTAEDVSRCPGGEEKPER